jgi:hypothetical protein
MGPLWPVILAAEGVEVRGVWVAWRYGGVWGRVGLVVWVGVEVAAASVVTRVKSRLPTLNRVYVLLVEGGGFESRRG